MNTKRGVSRLKIQLPIALKFCFVLTAGLILIACAKRGSAGKDADAAAIYTLVSVNGKPVPADVTHHGAALQVRSGTFTINADGTCGTKTVFVPPSGTEVTRKVDATYTRNGPRLTMQWKGAGKTVGTLDGDTFTMNNEGMIFVYRR